MTTLEMLQKTITIQQDKEDPVEDINDDFVDANDMIKRMNNMFKFNSKSVMY